METEREREGRTVDQARRGASRVATDQELLLRAALLEREPALLAWDEWKHRTRRNDFEPVAGAPGRLLPQLYRNLERHGVADRLMDTLRRAYRGTRSKNERMLERIGTVLRTLEGEGIATLVLKGAALATCHYRDIGARPMGDVDVLVPVGQVRDAMAVLLAHGWRHDDAPRPEVHIPYRHAANFRDASGCQLDLHWHIMIECCQAEADTAFWAAARDAEIAGAPTRILCPADQLLHVSVHGKKWRHRPSLIVWIVDAFMIMRSNFGELDWSRMATEAQARRLGFTMRCALEYLVEVLDAPVPAAALARVKSIPTSRLERLEHRTTSRARTHLLLGAVPVICFQFWRLQTVAGGAGRAVAFANFLRYYWRLQRARQIPYYLLMKTVRRGFGVPTGRLVRWLGGMFSRDVRRTN